MKEFFHDMVLINGKDYLLVKKDQYTDVPKEGRTGFSYMHIVSQNIANCTMQAVLLTVQPGAKGNSTTTDGYEFKYMISGACEYLINDESILLEEGDSLYFDASVPHIPINKSRKRVVMLVIYFIITK